MPNTKSSGLKNKPSKEKKEKIASFLTSKGVKNSDAVKICKINEDCDNEELSLSISEFLKKEKKK